MLNSAHDSSCACSSDEVVDQVLVRYYEARQIGDGLTHDAMRALAAQVSAPAGATVVANPTARPRSGLVDARIPGSGPCHFVGPDGTPHAAQPIAAGGGDGFQTMVTGQKVRWVLDLMRASEFAGRQIHAYEVTPVPNTTDQHDILLIEARGTDARIDLTELKEQMLALGEAGHTMSLKLEVAPVRHVLFDTGVIEGFGWSCFTAVEGEAPSTAVTGDADANTLTNEHLRVVVDASDGTYAIETTGLRVKGCGRLVDDGDGGDTYNYSPPADDTVVDRPEAVRVETTETGPARGRVTITTAYTWPAFAIGDERACTSRSDETVRATVRTTLELRPGERFLRVAHEIDNPARDHRLRAHFPLPAPVDGSDAECAFAVVHRGLTAEGGVHEYGLPDVPVPSLRRRGRRRGRARTPARRAPRIRGGRRGPGARAHAAALGRLPLADRTAAAPEPGRTAQRTRRPATPRETDRRVRSAVACGRLASGRLLRRRRRIARTVRTRPGGGAHRCKPSDRGHALSGSTARRYRPSTGYRAASS